MSRHQRGSGSKAASRETSLAHPRSRKGRWLPSGGSSREGLGHHETEVMVSLRTETGTGRSKLQRDPGAELCRWQMADGRAGTAGQVGLGLRTLTVSAASLWLCKHDPGDMRASRKGWSGRRVCSPLGLVDAWVPVTWPVNALKLSQFLPRSGGGRWQLCLSQPSPHFSISHCTT